jgi:hypothetical protein
MDVVAQHTLELKEYSRTQAQSKLRMSMDKPAITHFGVTKEHKYLYASNQAYMKASWIETMIQSLEFQKHLQVVTVMRISFQNSCRCYHMN